MHGCHRAFTVSDEHSLILAGHVAFADPPSQDAAQSLAVMNRDGVEVKILTSDNELVARHICEQVRIKNPTIILGEELERTTPPLSIRPKKRRPPQSKPPTRHLQV